MFQNLSETVEKCGQWMTRVKLANRLSLKPDIQHPNSNPNSVSLSSQVFLQISFLCFVIKRKIGFAG